MDGLMIPYIIFVKRFEAWSDSFWPLFSLSLERFYRIRILGVILFGLFNLAWQIRPGVPLNDFARRVDN